MTTDNIDIATQNTYEEIHTDRWGVIVNPVAGKRRLRKEWIEIYRTLKRAAIHFSVETTEYAGHATEITYNLLNNGFRKILIIGGDGTINEVVNGIFTSDIPDKGNVTIALIPYGTGNDWARYWGLNKLSRNEIVNVLYHRETTKVDIGLLKYRYNGKDKLQYFINGAGLGFDGLVVNITNRLKRIFGGHAWVYSISLLSAIFQYKSTNMTIKSLDKTITDNIFTISIGNSCYSGGGLKQTDGNPTDGKLYVTAIHHPTFLKLLNGLGFLFRGELFKHPLAETIEEPTFSITASRPIETETDGVELSTDGNYQFTTIPHALNMVIKPRNMKV